jgi:hypothetical protein
MKSVLNMIKSLLSAILGVRSQKDAEQDFAQFDYRSYIIVGVIMVLVVIGVLILLVKSVI